MAEAATKKPRAKKAEKPVEIVAYKAFDKNLQCRSYQYAVGQTYEHKGRVEICDQGFHACEAPLDVLNYYELNTSRFAKVTLSGTISRQTDGDTKLCAGAITIGAELTLPAFIKDAVGWIIKAAKKNVSTGDYSHAASTGNSSHAASTGYRSHAASTGNRSHAASTGDYSHAASTGNSSHAASTGNSSHAASTGYRSHAKTLGPNSVAASLWVGGTATAGDGGAIVLGYYDERTSPPTLTKIFAGMVGEDGIEASKTYRLTADGKPELVA